MDDLLRELVDLQKQQNALLSRYLWRFRFSLMTLLILMTATAGGLGFLIYERHANSIMPTATPLTTFWTAPSQGTLRVYSGLNGTVQLPQTPVDPGIDQAPEAQ